MKLSAAPCATLAAAVSALSPPTDKQAVAASGRLAVALKTVGADPESFGPDDAVAAADEAIVVEREALRIVRHYFGEGAAEDPISYLAGLADVFSL